MATKHSIDTTNMSIQNGNLEMAIKKYESGTIIPASLIITAIRNQHDKIPLELAKRGWKPPLPVIKSLLANSSYHVCIQVLDCFWPLPDDTTLALKYQTVLDQFLEWSIRHGLGTVVTYMYRFMKVLFVEQHYLLIASMNDNNMMRTLLHNDFRFPSALSVAPSLLMTDGILELLNNYKLRDILKFPPSENRKKWLETFLMSRSDMILDPTVLTGSINNGNWYSVAKICINNELVDILSQLCENLSNNNDLDVLATLFVAEFRDDKLWILNHLFDTINDSRLQNVFVSFINDDSYERLNNARLCINKKMCEGARNEMTLLCSKVENSFGDDLYLYRDSDGYLLEIDELLTHWNTALSSYNHMVTPVYPTHPYTNKPIPPSTIYIVANLCRIYDIKIPLLVQALILTPTVLQYGYQAAVNCEPDKTYEYMREYMKSIGMIYTGGDPETNTAGEWVLENDVDERRREMFEMSSISLGLLFAVYSRMEYLMRVAKLPDS